MSVRGFDLYDVGVGQKRDVKQKKSYDGRSPLVTWD